MASWNIPALINKISEDVPAIKALLTALFKWTDAGTEDVPEGAKRLQSVTGGRQIQEYSGSSWGSVGKLMHDVDMLDGKHASTAQTPDTIPVRDANGSIPGNITGNAATATTASSVSSEYVVPIANGGTGATSAANARTNLGTNNAENITQGVLATARGGTGRSDGKVTDVFLEDYQTGAVGLGQLGQSAYRHVVDCDTLTRQGTYYCDGCTVALHYPASWMSGCIVEVIQRGFLVTQRASTTDCSSVFSRNSWDNGASWSGWLPVNLIAGDFSIYISKGGSDTNNGFSADSPVLTAGRALNIALGLRSSGWITFQFGPGEWGDFYVSPQRFKCHGVKVTNYVRSNKNTVAEFDALTGSGNTGNQPPHFTTLEAEGPGRFYIGNIHADFVDCHSVSVNSNSFAFSYSQWKNCWASLCPQKVVKKDGVTNNVFYLEHSFLYMGDVANSFVNSPTNNAYVSCSTGAEIFFSGGISWTGTFSGKKFEFNAPAQIINKDPRTYPGSLAGTGPFFYYGNLFLNGQIVTTVNNPHITFFDSGITRGTAPSASRYDSTIQCYGASGEDYSVEKKFWAIYHEYLTNKTNRISFLVYKGTDTSNTFTTLGVGYDASGNAFTFAPKPSADSNGANIATTNWVRTATGGTTLKAATAGTADACAGNSATATKLQTARSIALGNAMMGSVNFDGSSNITLLALWRHAFVGQSTSPAVNPWYKVATAACTVENGDWEAVVLVENSYGVHHFGILRINVRTDGQKKISDDASGIHWLVRYGFNTADFVLVLPTSASPTAELWTKVSNDWMGRRFTVLSEGNRVGTTMTWNWLRTGLTNGQSASITTSGTQKTSVDSGYVNGANWCDTPPADSNNTRIASTAWVRGRLSGSEYSMVPGGWRHGRNVNGETWTADANGYFKVEHNDNHGQYECQVYINGVITNMHGGAYGSGGQHSGGCCIFPVRKGWTYVAYNSSWCDFQYAE